MSPLVTPVIDKSWDSKPCILTVIPHCPFIAAVNAYLWEANLVRQKAHPWSI